MGNVGSVRGEGEEGVGEVRVVVEVGDGEVVIGRGGGDGGDEGRFDERMGVDMVGEVEVDGGVGELGGNGWGKIVWGGVEVG